MTFLFIHTIGKNKFGGGERWVVKAAEGLMKAGHEATIIGLPGSKLLKAAEDAGIPAKGMNVVSDISPWHILKIRRYLLKNHTDVIITRVTDLFVAGMAYIWYVAGLDKDFAGIYPSVLANWAGIRYAWLLGYQAFDFMGAGNPAIPYGVRDFKARFGGEATNHGRYLLINRPAIYYLGKMAVSVYSRYQAS